MVWAGIHWHQKVHCLKNIDFQSDTFFNPLMQLSVKLLSVFLITEIKKSFFQCTPHMEVSKSSGDPEIGLTVAPSSYGQAPGLKLLEQQQWSIFFSALPQHENWPTQAVQWRKKRAKHAHESKADRSKLCFEGISIAPKLLGKPMEQPVHPGSWAEGLAISYRHCPSLALWSLTLLGMFCTCRLPSIRFPMNLPVFQVNTTWDKYKPLGILPQLSAVNPFQRLKANTEAFM